MTKLLSIAQIGPYRGSQPHAHDCWEIGLYLSGRGVAVVGKNRVPFSPGTVICYPPFVPHRELTRDSCLGFFITAKHCPFGESTRPLLTDDSRSDLLNLISLLHREWLQKGLCWEEATDHLFDLLLIHLTRLCSLPQPGHPLVRALRRQLDERMTDPDFHSGLALAALPMSPDHLRRLFAREVGCSPATYLNEQRMAAAKRLLNEGTLRVKEVAARVGIQDEHYFSRLFLKHTGQRPLAYSRAIPERR